MSFLSPFPNLSRFSSFGLRDSYPFGVKSGPTPIITRAIDPKKDVSTEYAIQGLGGFIDVLADGEPYGVQIPPHLIVVFNIIFHEKYNNKPPQKTKNKKQKNQHTIYCIWVFGDWFWR